MYIIFTDESGQPGGFDIEKKELVKNTSKYFILSGFMINSDEILKIEEKLRDIKLKYGLNPYHEVKWNTKYKAIGIVFEQIISMKKEIRRTLRIKEGDPLETTLEHLRNLTQALNLMACRIY